MTFKPNTFRNPVILKTLIGNKSSQTLLEFISNRFSYHNENEWIERIQNGQILVNDHKASKEQPLRRGDEITYTTEAWDEPEVNTNFTVVYEDEAILVISKPAPLPVHAIGIYFHNTLMHLLRQKRPEAETFHLVHRLDSETSGLLMLVKDKQYIKPLQKQWEAGEVQKTYQTIVFGQFFPVKQRCELSIGHLTSSSIRMKQGIDEINGKSSITDFNIIEIKEKFSLIEAKPLTGRTHQIRVHLENLGFPIVGDKLYSGSDEVFLRFIDEGWSDWMEQKVLIHRAALHALRLEFTHPIKGNRMRLEDPLSFDLLQFWKGLV